MFRYVELITLYFLFQFTVVHNNQELQYIGCFIDEIETNRLLNGHQENLYHANTPHHCVELCYSLGYLYAGLQFSVQCFCGDRHPFSEAKVVDGQCNMTCSGDKSEKCGSDWRLSIYSTSITDFPADGKHIGCFDDSRENRVLTGTYIQLKKTNSPRRCLNYCYTNNYLYAGLQDKLECFCGNDKLPGIESADSDCHLECPGDSSETCGGHWKLAVYRTGYASLKENTFEFYLPQYLGCFKDEGSQSKRLLKGYKQDLYGKLIPELCVDICRSKGFHYSATQYKYECFCDNKRPSYELLSNDNECNTPCDGDKKRMCGGDWKLSVYKTGLKSPADDMDNYIGCYQDGDGPNRLLKIKMKLFDNYLTPQLCISHCLFRGFKLAGLQWRVECFCGDSDPPPTKKVDDSECIAICSGDYTKRCGGDLKLSIYKTGVILKQASEIQARFIGCFNSKSKILRHYKVDLEDNSPQRCVGVCEALGYYFAGVEYGIECYCGYITPSKNLMVSNEECNTPCPIDKSQFCGSGWRLAVYSTGIAADTTIYNKDNHHLVDNNNRLCIDSVTKYNGMKSVCKNDVIFEDLFDSNISKDRWQHTVKISDLPDEDFVVFTNDVKNSFIKNGKLHIKPSLMPGDTVTHGKITLIGCTGRKGVSECTMEAVSYNILPPVFSAQLTTKNTFYFRYGIVQIIAKLPVGDWIISELSLEPKNEFYGPHFISGRINIAMTVGNENLVTNNGNEIGRKFLECGILMGGSDSIHKQHKKIYNSKGWNKEFHNFTLVWLPDDIKFIINGEENSIISSNGNKKLCSAVGLNELCDKLWDSESKIAPFDQDFYLKIGLTVGGNRVFPDNSISNGYLKPWKNTEVKD
ncbi:uncharacterized protein LOC142332726 isoform X2 [Lycorma delicatula]|uniref:uncharacterized protein LOC142332726 isoform X2 n=1 Tax=Lycorma delicatula TaxID=130591 RepID=UPI003F517234